MIKKVKLEVCYSMGLVGCKRNDVIDIEIDTNWTAGELDKNMSEIAMDWMWETIDLGYGIKE